MVLHANPFRDKTVTAGSPAATYTELHRRAVELEREAAESKRAFHEAHNLERIRREALTAALAGDDDQAVKAAERELAKARKALEEPLAERAEGARLKAERAVDALRRFTAENLPELAAELLEDAYRVHTGIVRAAAAVHEAVDDYRDVEGRVGALLMTGGKVPREVGVPIWTLSSTARNELREIADKCPVPFPAGLIPQESAA